MRGLPPVQQGSTAHAIASVERLNECLQVPKVQQSRHEVALAGCRQGR